MTYIVVETDPNIDGDVYPVDTVEEIEIAKAALRDAGHDSAPVFTGEPPDSYRNGQVLFAE